MCFQIEFNISFSKIKEGLSQNQIPFPQISLNGKIFRKLESLRGIAAFAVVLTTHLLPTLLAQLTGREFIPVCHFFYSFRFCYHICLPR